MGRKRTEALHSPRPRRHKEEEKKATISETFLRRRGEGRGLQKKFLVLASSAEKEGRRMRHLTFRAPEGKVRKLKSRREGKKHQMHTISSLIHSPGEREKKGGPPSCPLRRKKKTEVDPRSSLDGEKSVCRSRQGRCCGKEKKPKRGKLKSYVGQYRARRKRGGEVTAAAH